MGQDARRYPEGMNGKVRAIETIATFDATSGEHPENVAFGRDGTLYVTLHRAVTVWCRAPDGTATTIAFPASPTGGTRANGIIVETDGGVAVAVRSDDPAIAGVWRIGADGDPQRAVALPADAGLNGMAQDGDGALYLADDTLGRIWRIPTGGARAEVWADEAALAPQGPSPSGFPVYGANGIKVHDGAVYVSNSSTGRVLRLPIAPDGAADGLAEYCPGVAFHNIDDFAFDAAGNLYFTKVVDHTVERVAPDGRVTTLLTRADGLDMPSAVAFGVLDTDRTRLYVTNAAFWSPPGVAPRAGLLRCDVGMPGASLPGGAGE